MPKLLMFAPCEKILEDKASNNISLISIMQEVTFIVPKDIHPLPANAMAPQSWSIFAMWQRDDDERPEFETQAILLAPDDTKIIGTAVAKIDFLSYTVLSQRLIMHLQGFPVGHPGKCNVALFTKQKGEAEFTEVARFLLTVNQAVAGSPEAAKVLAVS